MKIPDHLPWKSTGTTLGSGGQGDVELVTRSDDRDGRQYALKALKRVGSSQARQRFRTEIEAVKSLAHKAIVPVVDQSEPDDEFQFYVMEYVEGAKPLDRIIFDAESNPFHANAPKSLDLFHQIVSAIHACERANPQIVHRDINPKNILVAPDETIRLIDFGICQVQDWTKITLVDEDVGTRHYTSPECENGNDSEIGVHSDIYSAGKVLWSAITSRHAFARETPVFSNLSMRELFPNQPDTWHLSLLFEKTIRMNVGDRYLSTRDLLGLVSKLRKVIQDGFAPLEKIIKRCLNCGWNDMRYIGSVQGDIFVGRDDMEVAWFKCEFCGFLLPRDFNTLRNSLDRTENLS